MKVKRRILVCIGLVSSCFLISNTAFAEQYTNCVPSKSATAIKEGTVTGWCIDYEAQPNICTWPGHFAVVGTVDPLIKGLWLSMLTKAQKDGLALDIGVSEPCVGGYATITEIKWGTPSN